MTKKIIKSQNILDRKYFDLIKFKIKKKIFKRPFILLKKLYNFEVLISKFKI